MFTHLNRWTLPDCYVGPEWLEYFVFLGQHRDSDALSRSNFICGLELIGGESDTVRIVREHHWAVGWVEWIAIHESDCAALEKANEIADGLDDYPVVDESHWSDTEQEDADETWRECFSPRERISYIRENRSQFEFRGLADVLGCVRGEYFAGYASELLN